MADGAHRLNCPHLLTLQHMPCCCRRCRAGALDADLRAYLTALGGELQRASLHTNLTAMAAALAAAVVQAQERQQGQQQGEQPAAGGERQAPAAPAGLQPAAAPAAEQQQQQEGGQAARARRRARRQVVPPRQQAPLAQQPGGAREADWLGGLAPQVSGRGRRGWSTCTAPACHVAR
jgi:hypothetical protein